MKPKQILTFLKHLVFIPKCAICDELLSPIPPREDGATHGKICFCKSCTEKWEKAKVEMCPSCYNISGKCTCTPDFFFKFQPDIPSLCYYTSNTEDPASKVIITMKRQNHTQLFEFITEELGIKLSSTLDKMGIDGKDCIFTWIPRKSKAIRESGFDQGRLLARGLSSYFGAECMPLFLRIGGKEQKKLDKRLRKRNADLHIKLNENMKGFPKNFKETDLPSFIEGKNIIIVDDVLTSGATLRRGVELLLPLRPANTVVSCVAKSVKNDKRLKN